MHSIKWFLILSAVLLAVPLGVAQNSMLNAFDSPSAVPGTIVVSFAENVTRAQAEEVLQKHGLSILIESRCVTESYGGPGQSPVSTQKCEDDDSWIEDLKIAHAQVAPGTEKEIAAQLIEEPEIIYVEPLYEASAAGNGKDVENPQVPSTSGNPLDNTGNIAFESVGVLAGTVVLIALLLGAAWYATRKQ